MKRQLVMFLVAMVVLALQPSVHGLEKRTEPSDDDSGSVVDLGYARYQGYVKPNRFIADGMRSWRGIRYAQSPMGDLRWRAPQEPPLSNDTTIYSALNFGPQCPQTPNAAARVLPGGNKSHFHLPTSEDCLFLNVYSPTQAKNLPVLVWIHGGGFGQGGGRDNPSELIMNGTHGGSMVVVTSNYRLGAFGFASSQQIRDEGDLNVGLLDQHAVLQWVQKHIRNFGGDPTRVTLGGESAGGGAVMIHAVSYNGTLGNSLFHQLITSSPSLHKPVQYNDGMVQEYFQRFAESAGCPTAQQTSSAVMQCLRQAPTATLAAASQLVSVTEPVWGQWAFNPVQDGKLLVDLPSRLLAAKRVNGHRMLTGNNAEEGPMFVPQNLTTMEDAQDWLSALYPRLTPKDLQAAIDLYLPLNRTLQPENAFATSGFGDPSVATIQSTATGAQSLVDTLLAEATYICTGYWLAEAYSGDARASWKYQHSVVPAIHASDMSALFSHQGSHWKKATLGQQYRAAFQSIWRSFIVTGSPTSDRDFFAPDGSLNLRHEDHTDLTRYWINGSSAERLVTSTPSNLGKKWTQYDPAHPIMLNLNQTGGQITSRYVYGRYPTTMHVGPGLENHFSLVRAHEWESGRGARCTWWRDNMWKIPG